MINLKDIWFLSLVLHFNMDKLTPRVFWNIPPEGWCVCVRVLRSGEKKFVCTECSKRFMRSDHLAKHIKTHQNKKGGVPASSPPTTDTLITADGTTLILQTTTTHDLVANQEIPLQLVTVAPGEVMEWWSGWGNRWAGFFLFCFCFFSRTGLSQGPLGLFLFPSYRLFLFVFLHMNIYVNIYDKYIYFK